MCFNWNQLEVWHVCLEKETQSSVSNENIHTDLRTRDDSDAFYLCTDWCTTELSIIVKYLLLCDPNEDRFL